MPRAHRDDKTAPARRHPLLAPAACVVGVILFTFLPLLRNDFIDWDDPTAIVQNPRLNPPTFAGLASYWGRPRLGEEFYVPLNYTAWWLLAAATRPAAGPLPPWPFHAVSWLVHAANALLVLIILHRLTAKRWAAALGAMLFALHPVQVEPVAWASSMYSSLSGLFALVGVWQYLQFSAKRDGPAEPARRPGGWGHYAVATAAFVAAMLTKPTVVVVPVMIVVIDVMLRGRRIRSVALPLGAWLVLAAPVMLLVRAAEHAAPVYVPPPPWRALLALDSLAFYLYKLVLPIGLAPDYGRSPQWVLAQPEVYYTWAATAVLLAVAWHFRRNACWALAATLLFIAALLPTLGLVPFDYQRYSTVADRYLYLAMLGPAVALAFALSRWPRASSFAAATVWVVILAALCHVQCFRWSDSRTLFTHTLSVNPRSLAAHVVFGYLYAAQGHDDAALAEFDQALRANSSDAAALTHVGNIYLRRGEFAKAVDSFRQALLFGGHSSLNINLGVALAQSGRIEEAVAALNEAVARVPDSADAHANLGNVLAVRQDWPSARREYEAALRLDPNSSVARQGLARLNSMGH